MNYYAYQIIDKHHQQPIFFGVTQNPKLKEKNIIALLNAEQPKTKSLNLKKHLYAMGQEGQKITFSTCGCFEAEETALTVCLTRIEKLLQEGKPTLNKSKPLTTPVQNNFSNTALTSYFSQMRQATATATA